MPSELELTRTRSSRPRRAAGKSMSVTALFAGVGGIECGFHTAGLRTRLFCEIDEAAQRVLRAQFPDVPCASDIADLADLPASDVVTAGFPCQDLSQAGEKRGIVDGRRSSLVSHLFRLLGGKSKRGPKWLVIENVPYMLSLHRGHAMSFLTEELSRLGYRWAYRSVDARSFGVPQRRIRVLLVASRTEDPRQVLFADEHGSIPVQDRLYFVDHDFWYGFYWTEGLRGVGWAESSVPPIKGGSSIGIPSPPAVWKPQSGEIGTIDIRDAERLQGLSVDWTLPAVADGQLRASARWRLVGNAVCARVATWLGRRLVEPGPPVCRWSPLPVGSRWPDAAWGDETGTYVTEASLWPANAPYEHLEGFLQYPLKPLSAKATAGYYARIQKCPYRVTEEFITAVAAHLKRVQRMKE